MYAYNDHCEPPSFALEPNVYVQSTAGFIRGRFTFEELMELWPRHCRNLGFYEYFSVWLWDFDTPPGGRGADVKLIQERIRRYAALGATSLDCESGNNWGVHGRGYYLASKLMWDPDADADAVLKDFYQQAFGPAAAVMKRYYERLDPGNKPLVSRHLLALALRDLDQATRLAQGRGDVLARLDHLKQYQHYVRLRWEYDRASDPDRKAELALRALTHVYRTRYSYMNHWEAMRQSWAGKAAEQFGKPAWAPNAPGGGQPWKVERPLTREETRQLFQDDLAFFEPQPIAERGFSTDLVPPGFTSERPAASLQRFQKGARYALYSPDGKPVEVTVQTGLIAWYRDRPEAAFTVADSDGNEITRGRLAQDGKEHPIRIEVPGPGLYWLDFNDQAAGWGIRAEPGRSVALALERATHPSHMGHMQRMYFYVPEGTAKIQYFWKGRPHVVHTPEGEPAAEVTSSGEFVTVDVPPGTAGRAWSLSKLALGHLWFFNVPNYLSASPDALLVPRETAAPERTTP
jgi:hypothetical protein